MKPIIVSRGRVSAGSYNMVTPDRTASCFLFMPAAAKRPLEHQALLRHPFPAASNRVGRKKSRGNNGTGSVRGLDSSGGSRGGAQQVVGPNQDEGELHALMMEEGIGLREGNSEPEMLSKDARRLGIDKSPKEDSIHSLDCVDPSWSNLLGSPKYLQGNSVKCATEKDSADCQSHKTEPRAKERTD
ncbi:hypothetical protein BS47DRAFT_1364796 [Hydnum rufescens UP504]|uniref:Uncharacterized protein n=1 Tax=Hydnum rufescens UP504 TaxID=1448309 RepID=A0A9P6AQK1_9AGAM|nr:hypothetical protein BS47DRAFT_1364796 [Hydnum rufescens UP504]